MSTTTPTRSVALRDLTGIAPVRLDGRVGRDSGPLPGVPVDRVTLSRVARLLSLAAPDQDESDLPLPDDERLAGDGRSFIDAEFEALADEDPVAAPQPFAVSPAGLSDWRCFVQKVVGAHAGLADDGP